MKLRIWGADQSADNGNVMGIANNRNTVRSETFTYDALNRVSSAWSNGNLWGETYSIDPWGNLNQFGPYENSQNQILPFVEASQSLAANTQNQVSAFCYDTAGNVLAEAGSQCPPALGSGFVYNAENQLTFAGGTNYVYDGDGNRVEKYMVNTQNQIVFQELYWYGGGSASLDETDGTGSTTDSAFNEYVFFDGARTARRNSGGVYYYFADHLGTSREIVQSGSTTPCYDADFTPYGAEMVCTNTCQQNYKFTGKERDTESGLDNFSARYDASGAARFMSPDPLGGHQEDPQTLNKYVYVRNSPLGLTDPTGLDFNLTCSKNNGTTCQGGYVYYEDKNGKYQETVIRSDDNGTLTDQSGNKYAGTFDGHSVTFTDANGDQSGGTWIDHSNDTKGITGGGTLSDKFSFTFGNHGNSQTLEATFTYQGTLGDAIDELKSAGYSFSAFDQTFNIIEMFAHPGARDYRTQGDPGTGRNSGHALVNVPFFSLHPLDSVPATGSVHTGETNPKAGFSALWQHLAHEL